MPGSDVLQGCVHAWCVTVQPPLAPAVMHDTRARLGQIFHPSVSVCGGTRQGVKFMSGLLCSGLERLDHFGLQLVFGASSGAPKVSVVLCMWPFAFKVAVVCVDLLLPLGQQP
jgi:hypothetical protein